MNEQSSSPGAAVLCESCGINSIKSPEYYRRACWACLLAGRARKVPDGPESFLVTVRRDVPAGWRSGQALMNALAEWRPDLEKAVRGTTADPFYREERLPIFESWLLSAWSAKAPARPAESVAWP